MSDTLYTVDEARIEFLRSAVAVLECMPGSTMRLRLLLAGTGGHTNLHQTERAVVYAHWALIAELELAGYDSVLEDELEGLLSCLATEGPATAGLVRDQLPTEPLIDAGIAA